MEVYCTRPGCPRPVNYFADLDNSATLKTVQQKYCMGCGMPLILVGRYITQRLLGKGGFGAAFLARDRYTPAMRQCVVKQFQPSGDLTPTQLQVAQNLFEREGAVLEELGNTHPQIPDLLAFFELDVPRSSGGQADRFFYLVQEFIDGQNLEEELAQNGPFSEAAIREVLIEILKVLQFVHEHGSIHRDIKPSNIMRRRDGRLYLLDFGAVKQVTQASAAEAGKASTGIYSMGFAPPEQMAGNVVYPATDLYALGVTCITLLTGKQPNELYDPYSNGWNWSSYGRVSDRLKTVLDRMLLATPSQRFQSAEEVLEALQGSAAAPPGLPPRPAQPPPNPAAVSNPVMAAPPPPSSTPARLPKRPVQAPAIKTAPPAPPVAAPPPPAAPIQAATPAPLAAPKRGFSLMESIVGAAFTGFEGSLLAIALISLLGTTFLSAGFWLLLLGVLVLAQWNHVIEKVDLLILAVLTVGIIILLPPLRDFWILQAIGNPIRTLLLISVLAGLVAVAATLVFRLVYKLLSGLF
ncbi:serine/threonine protein kinase [Oscillatoria sp. FACHB-1407]|uniref:serine/threonine-protein kinase n=1 Tax=Oscillatoria sp. FACHB-1407 TaxID=2692847 RepID=UPI001688ED5B|nr:serine/threonine-protein kinase [Oscillatoria sp. FACHB-1407]MBD2460979.1 serine/threonine protein kinase [Oscillatoria sp. FACHB-1407]